MVVKTCFEAPLAPYCQQGVCCLLTTGGLLIIPPPPTPPLPRWCGTSWTRQPARRRATACRPSGSSRGPCLLVQATPKSSSGRISCSFLNQHPSSPAYILLAIWVLPNIITARGASFPPDRGKFWLERFGNLRRVGLGLTTDPAFSISFLLSTIRYISCVALAADLSLHLPPCCFPLRLCSLRRAIFLRPIFAD